MLNVTPDSFSDGGRYLDHGAAIARAEEMRAQGADVVDVGGESTRPRGAAYGAGAEPVSAREELARVVPVVRGLVERGIPVSVDTSKADVAREVLGLGAAIINDVSGGRSGELVRAVAAAGARLVLMHNRGAGEVTEANTRYGDVVSDVCRELGDAASRAAELGVPPEHLWLDPGLGFAKTAEQSASLLDGTDRLVALGFPVLVGASRKAFVAALAPLPNGERPATEDRLGGSLAAAVIAVLRGARAVRVHDVDLTRQALDLSRWFVHL